MNRLLTLYRTQLAENINQYFRGNEYLGVKDIAHFISRVNNVEMLFEVSYVLSCLLNIDEKQVSIPKYLIRDVNYLTEDNHSYIAIGELGYTNTRLLVKYNKDTGLREFLIGLYYMNTVREYIPNFIFTFASFKCGSMICGDRLIDTCAGSRMNEYCVYEYVSDADFLKKFLADNHTDDEIITVIQQILLALSIAYEKVGYVNNYLKLTDIVVKDLKKLFSIHYIDRYIGSRYVPYFINYSKATIRGEKPNLIPFLESLKTTSVKVNQFLDRCIQFYEVDYDIRRSELLSTYSKGDVFNTPEVGKGSYVVDESDLLSAFLTKTKNLTWKINYDKAKQFAKDTIESLDTPRDKIVINISNRQGAYEELMREFFRKDAVDIIKDMLFAIS